MMDWGFFYKPRSKEERVADALARAERGGATYPSIEYNGPSHIRIPAGASTLSKEVLIDKIKGLLFGNAIGDAVGLYTEFNSKRESVARYGPKGPIHFNESIRGWDAGDWTDDTDQMILILDGLIAHGGVVDAMDFAKRLKIWVRYGFAELGDWGGNGCGGVVSRSVFSEHFLSDPHRAAMEVYQNSRGFAAANGAVMRTSVLGIPDFHDLEKVKANTKNISLTTHGDPRCTASVVAATTALARMLQGQPVNTPAEIEALVQQSIAVGSEELKEHPAWKDEFVEHMSATKWKHLSLDESAKIGYTFKCVGSGFCAVRRDDFYETITELALEGGDADTNCAVAGALLGCKVGFNALPRVWLDKMPYRDWLMKRVDRFLELLGLMDPVGPAECKDANSSAAVADDVDVQPGASSSVSDRRAADASPVPAAQLQSEGSHLNGA